MPFHDQLVQFDNDKSTGDLLINRTQEIPGEFLDHLQLMRANSIQTPMGEMHCACVVPTTVIEQWKREGFDAMDPSVSIEDVMRRLRKQELDNFIATQRRIY